MADGAGGTSPLVVAVVAVLSALIGAGATLGVARVQWMRWECGVGFCQLRKCGRTRPARYAPISDIASRIGAQSTGNVN